MVEMLRKLDNTIRLPSMLDYLPPVPEVIPAPSPHFRQPGLTWSLVQITEVENLTKLKNFLALPSVTIIVAVIH